MSDAQFTREQVSQLLHTVFIDAPGTQLRREDLKKVDELTAFLNELARLGTKGPLVDAAAGKSYLGVLAAHLLPIASLTVIERNAQRISDSQHAIERLGLTTRATVQLGDVNELQHWPESAATVVGLHACGAASDAIVDAAIAREATTVLLVPCCYGADISFWSHALTHADRLGLPRSAELRKPFVQSLIMAERVLRLQAAGYDTTVAPLVPPTVTPHHLLIRARRVREPVRMAQARSQLETLRR